MRLIALMTILAAVDTAFVTHCGLKFMEMGPSVFMLFGLEFFILLITCVATFLRYILFTIDARMDGNWANKFTYLFYLELLSEILKLLVYLVFFLIIIQYYGMPLHLVRDVWLTIKGLQRRVASYFRYRKITANLNERFPNPTEEELQQTDRTCIICREEMTAAACKKLPCTHIFHVDCLKMWVQRQQTCPTCRSTIPTGAARPPVVPQQPPAAVPQPEPAAPPFAGPNHIPVPPVQPAGTNTPLAQPQQATTGAADHAPQRPAAQGHHQFVPGQAPVVPPYMFGPGMSGTPFGFGFPPTMGMLPPFGFPLQPPQPSNSAHGQNQAHPLADPARIQQQIDLLHAQLAALQAASQAYGFPLPQPMTSQPVAVSARPSPTTEPVIQPPASNEPSTPVTVQPTSDGSHGDTQENLEEKAPVPIASSMAVTRDDVEEEEEKPSSEPVETTIPRVLTDAERRREELRQRYNRIYGSSSSNGGSTDERKRDE
ncbi:hypothetical protein PINS_up005246 [Pythium insidiosum]|nr:hypothetical protein PINS_up005246 [Pythium insidiosum]